MTTTKQASVKKIHKIKVVREACISAATCVVLAKEAFELDAEGIAVVKPTALTLDDNQILIAAQSCPTQAILLFDEFDNQIFP